MKGAEKERCSTDSASLLEVERLGSLKGGPSSPQTETFGLERLGSLKARMVVSPSWIPARLLEAERLGSLKGGECTWLLEAERLGS